MYLSSQSLWLSVRTSSSRFERSIYLQASLVGVTNLEGACEYTMNFFIWITFSSSVIAEICFMLRAYALWGISPFAAIFLFILTLGMIAALVVIALNLPTLNNAGNVFSSLHATQNVNTNATETPFTAVVAVCFTSEGSLPGSVTGSSIVLLCVDAIVALMVISAKQKRFRAHGTNPLLKRIYQDSIVYFACNCLVMTGSIVISTKLPTASILATRKPYDNRAERTWQQRVLVQSRHRSVDLSLNDPVRSS
ncbi:hypothetical protein D9756_007260 [Leucocoprinus leucothites]|uniref:Uncharacterized protein n=1 Tax=Leucocoprinus leucothites TaxID=201217 RepID=A0A8H5D5C5_9AGAR|nr:hypothetical protein D9756_007260 [Leucoagaricus leucothites]